MACTEWHCQVYPQVLCLVTRHWARRYWHGVPLGHPRPRSPTGPGPGPPDVKPASLYQACASISAPLGLVPVLLLGVPGPQEWLLQCAPPNLGIIELPQLGKDHRPAMLVHQRPGTPWATGIPGPGNQRLPKQNLLAPGPACRMKRSGHPDTGPANGRVTDMVAEPCSRKCLHTDCGRGRANTQHCRPAQTGAARVLATGPGPFDPTASDLAPDPGPPGDLERDEAVQHSYRQVTGHGCGSGCAGAQPPPSSLPLCGLLRGPARLPAAAAGALATEPEPGHTVHMR